MGTLTRIMKLEVKKAAKLKTMFERLDRKLDEDAAVLAYKLGVRTSEVTLKMLADDGNELAQIFHEATEKLKAHKAAQAQTID